MAHGGRRPNSGNKKGVKFKATLTKELAREVLRDIVKEHLAEMTSAQVAAAKGLKYLMMRDKTGTFKPVSREQIEALPPEDHHLVEVWDKQPSTPAFTDLLNRTLDKPKESVELEHKGDIRISINAPWLKSKT